MARQETDTPERPPPDDAAVRRSESDDAYAWSRRWRPSGYLLPRLVSARITARCGLRLVHERIVPGHPDPLAFDLGVMTVGDARGSRGAPEPVATTGEGYLTIVALRRDEPGGDGDRWDMMELERVASGNHATAHAIHMALLRKWADRPARPPARSIYDERPEDVPAAAPEEETIP
jgi:hypothetical protein